MCKKRQTIRDVRSKSNEKGLIHSIRKNKAISILLQVLLNLQKIISRENDQRSHAIDRLPKCNQEKLRRVKATRKY